MTFHDTWYVWFCSFVAFLCWKKMISIHFDHQKNSPANTKLAALSSILFSQKETVLFFWKSRTLLPLLDVQSILHWYHSRLHSILCCPKDFCSTPGDAQPPPPNQKQKRWFFRRCRGFKNGTKTVFLEKTVAIAYTFQLQFFVNRKCTLCFSNVLRRQWTYIKRPSQSKTHTKKTWEINKFESNPSFISAAFFPSVSTLLFGPVFLATKSLPRFQSMNLLGFQDRVDMILHQSIATTVPTFNTLVVDMAGH